MLHTDVQDDLRHGRGESVRLRTLIVLRWMAIAGQVSALIAASLYFGLKLPLIPCAAAVGVSVLANIAAMLAYPASKRLSDGATFLMLLFDLLQLGVLLFLTGGLSNPFALLVLAPVTISATSLDLRSTLAVAGFSAVLVTLIAFVSIPLQPVFGEPLAMAPVFKFGFWLALIIGIAFLGLYTRRVAIEMRAMSDALFAAQMALAREQKLTDLGGVVAAAAHELGTPLATIKLVSTELIDELAGQVDLQEDARLIGQQADRCRDILQSMGRTGKDDLHLRQAPLITVVREAAEPHMERGKRVTIAFMPDPQPNILRRPEVIHGLRNLIQNAVDFARSRVWIDLEWSAKTIDLIIVDDGDGFPQHIVGRIGDPYIRPGKYHPTLRPHYAGMGLGLFIAKTLLERSGAKLTFANAADPFLSPSERPDRCGAIVQVSWPTDRLLAPSDLAHGINQPNQY